MLLSPAIYDGRDYCLGPKGDSLKVGRPMVGHRGKNMFRSKLGHNSPITPLLIVALLLFFDMSALAMPSGDDVENEYEQIIYSNFYKLEN